MKFANGPLKNCAHKILFRCSFPKLSETSFNVIVFSKKYVFLRGLEFFEKNPKVSTFAAKFHNSPTFFC